MNISFISDLHLEFADLTIPGGDVLILAGDVCEAKNIRPELYQKDQPFNTKRQDRYARFFMEELVKYQRVLYVMGNHEHYGMIFDDTHDLLKSLVPNNVTVLEKQHVIIDNVIFLGGSLWTDFNNNDPLTMWDVPRNMNDFSVIKKLDADLGSVKRLRAEHVLKEFNDTLQYFASVLDANINVPTVVITHHAPSKQSINEKFRSEHIMNGGFASNLDNFILKYPQITHWIHGHMHDPVDYHIGNTQILSNPRGYTGYERQANLFDTAKSFAI